MNKVVIALAGISVILFSGCASIMNGTQQTIQVLTPPVKNAECTLENDKGKWQLNTPGMVMVRRSEKPLIVTCEKEAFHKKSKTVKSELSKMVYGNILVGGGALGGTVDRTNGSAFVYPIQISVPMVAK